MKKKVLLSVLAAVLVIAVGVMIAYGNLILTALSVKQPDDSPVRHVKIYGDCWLDDCMKTDIKSGADLNRFFMEKTTLGLKKDLSQRHKACSAFFAVSPEGDYLLCNNVDLLSPDSRIPLVMESSILGSHAFTIGYADAAMYGDGGFISNMNLYFMPYNGFGGINEDGLAAAVATSYGSYMTPAEGNTYMLDSTITQMVLSNAGSVDEAVEFLRGYNISCDKGYDLYHYLLADASGKSVIVEWDGDMKVIESDADYQAMSNFKMVDMSGFGKERYNGIVEGLEQSGGVVTEQQAMELLKANRIKGAEFVSVVYNLTQRKASVYFDCSGKVVEFELND